MTVFAKDPEALLDYSIDWTGYLTGGETIQTSDWSILPNEVGGLALVADAVDGTTSQVSVSDGVAGHQYRLSNRIATDQGRIDERSITIRIMNR